MDNMPTNRTRRRRARIEPDVIAALRSGTHVEWSPENWALLIGACYFRDHALTDDERERARELLDAWREQQFAHERAQRAGIVGKV
jgi:hypothetical protein